MLQASYVVPCTSLGRSCTDLTAREPENERWNYQPLQKRQQPDSKDRHPRHRVVVSPAPEYSGGQVLQNDRRDNSGTDKNRDVRFARLQNPTSAPCKHRSHPERTQGNPRV